MIKYGFSETISKRMKNNNNDWISLQAGNIVDKPGTALERFKSEGYFCVYSNPSFKINRGSKVYTIGSCFARNIERSLASLGMTVPTLDLKVDQSIYVHRPAYPNTILNKYNPHSMALEIDRGLGRRDLENMGLLKLAEDSWFDPQASHVGAMSWDCAVQVRSRVDALYDGMKNCEFLLLTLGLTETWFDEETNVALNQMNPMLLRPIRSRLKFANVDAADAISALRDSLRALHSANSDMKIVITVSPVPLSNTFTEYDVVCANAWSKANLIVVARTLALELEYVDYFPSYEMVINSPRHLAWSQDYLHVRNEMVDFVVGQFIDRYVIEA